MENTLAEYLRERNVQTEAWIAEDPANRWAGMYTEDLSHWAEMPEPIDYVANNYQE